MMESCIPPGFRFHPTDEELVGYYLKKKVASQKIDLDVIRDIDLYRIEPWDLRERCRIGYEEQSEWYFFSHKDKKYPTGTRTNRATVAGFWKATGRDKAVYDKTKLIGMRKTLVFYKGRAPNGQKTDWIMHEYRLEHEDQNNPTVGPGPQEEGWVVCRAFKKRISGGQTKNNVESWADSSYFYEEPCGLGSVDYISSSTQPPPHNPNFPENLIFCQKGKAENHKNNLSSFIHSDDDHSVFIQLPQLESPSLPSTKIMSSPESGQVFRSDRELDPIRRNDDHHLDKVTDWRTLDKFVASQLMSQDDRNQGEGFLSSALGCAVGFEKP